MGKIDRYVDNPGDDGSPGQLRTVIQRAAALHESPIKIRVCVDRVELTNPLDIGHTVWLDGRPPYDSGQSAEIDGEVRLHHNVGSVITDLSFSNASRMGNGDGLLVGAGTHDLIVSRCAFTRCHDESVDVNASGKANSEERCRNILFEECLFGGQFGVIPQAGGYNPYNALVSRHVQSVVFDHCYFVGGRYRNPVSGADWTTIVGCVIQDGQTTFETGRRETALQGAVINNLWIKSIDAAKTWPEIKLRNSHASEQAHNLYIDGNIGFDGGDIEIDDPDQRLLLISPMSGTGSGMVWIGVKYHELFPRFARPAHEVFKHVRSEAGPSRPNAYLQNLWLTIDQRRATDILLEAPA